MSTALYQNIVRNVGKLVPARFQPFWKHPAGPQTVFFWAPTMKWCLVAAGIADYSRPASQLSLTQSTALAATGTIWARYSLVIIPKNYNLFAVNIFLGITGYWQLMRIYNYEKAKKLEESKST